MIYYDHGDWAAHVATKADNAALCDLLKNVRVRGNLDMAQERDPDFFALLECHGAPYFATVIKDRDGRAQGCGSAVLRDGWLFGAKRRVVYLSDLRIRPEFSGKHVMSTAYAKVLDRCVSEGAEAAYIVVIGSNERMQKIVAAAHPGMPVHKPIVSFDMTSLQLTYGARKPTHTTVETARDLDELAAFLDRGHTQREFGYVNMRDVITKRCATWPGFSLDNFLVARRDGRLVGCVALWDSSPVKRTRMMGYGGSFLWIKRASDLLAPLAGFRPLPAPGDLLRYQYATHLEILNDDPRVLADLLGVAKARLDRSAWHFLSAMIPVGSPLARAFSGPFVQRTRMHLHALVQQASPLRERSFQTLRPGFEMALN